MSPELQNALIADRPFRVAAVQMCSGPEPPQNLKRALHWIDDAAKLEADLICLPENALYLRIDDDEVAPVLFPVSIQLDILQQKAREHGVWLMIGSLPEASYDLDRPYNSTVVIDPVGRIRASYRKIHLFSLTTGNPSDLNEAATIAPGSEPIIADTPFGGIGLTICYDLRFPELYRALTAAGATVLTVPSAFTKRTGEVHWLPLLMARAIENQCFVIAPNQTGHHGGNRHSYGHSVILGPWGEILAQADDQPGVIVADIDPEQIRKIRSRVPCLNDMRFGIHANVQIQK
jgi:predicted amidohydrolase